MGLNTATVTKTQIDIADRNAFASTKMNLAPLAASLQRAVRLYHNLAQIAVSKPVRAVLAVVAAQREIALEKLDDTTVTQWTATDDSTWAGQAIGQMDDAEAMRLLTDNEISLLQRVCEVVAEAERLGVHHSDPSLRKISALRRQMTQTSVVLMRLKPSWKATPAAMNADLARPSLEQTHLALQLNELRHASLLSDQPAKLSRMAGEATIASRIDFTA